MKKIILIVMLFTTIISGGCNLGKKETACSLNDQYSCKAIEDTKQEPIPAIDVAKKIIESLKNNDIQTFAKFVDQNGVRFSAYSYVDTGTDKVLNQNQIISAFENAGNIMVRGSYDGSGEPIKLNIKDYFSKFVFDTDYSTGSEVIQNEMTIRGNTTNNAFEIYTENEIIEFYMPGQNPEYGGLDRKSLTLVLKQKDNQRYLIGIIHGEWTI